MQSAENRVLSAVYAPEYLKKMVNDPNLDYEAVRSYRRKIMEEYLKTVKVDIKPGAVEILTYLKDKNIHRAVATASDLERTTRYLKQFGLYEYFDKIVCAPMVEHGKPAPDVYEYACSQWTMVLCRPKRSVERLWECDARNNPQAS